jgi:hypothetical protein
MTADIIRAQNTIELRARVNTRLQNGEGWTIEGAPFADSARGEWCWAVKLEGKAVAPGGIKLREPTRKAS